MAVKKKRARRKKAAPESRGLAPSATRLTPASQLQELAQAIENDGGAVLAAYNDPFGGKPVLFAVLPLNRVEPTPYQRDPSDAHVKRLVNVIESIGSFLDPIIAIRQDAVYWTPNGNHRLQALKKLGARSITALVVPDQDLAFKILALNTEKAHNLREKSLETIRMARAFGAETRRKESDLTFEFEEPSFVTLGICYERRPRFSGSVYQPVLRRVDAFLEVPVPEALEEREKRAQKLLALDDVVAEIVGKLQERGLKSPYLKPFVAARINPIRFSKSSSFDFDEVIDKMTASARRFNVDKVKQEDIVHVGGAPPEE